MKKGFLMVSIILVLGTISSYYMGCNKTDHPFGVYAPNGLDVPSPTFTPAFGAINCYVYDGSPKMGVTVNLVDPIGNTLFTKITDQYGNSPFSPYPLVTGVYSANVPTQGRYRYSSLPITITSTSQGAVSVQFLAQSQALSISGGVPVSFGTGTGTFPITLSYLQSGTLDVPVSVTTSLLPSSWNSSPSTFVMNMAVSTQLVTINKLGCSALNRPITWTGIDFLGNTKVARVNTTAYRNYPVNIALTLTTSSNGNICSGLHSSVAQYNYVYTLSSPSDCNTSWLFSVIVPGSFGSSTTSTGYISNGGNFTVPNICGNSSSFSVSISSPIGTASGSGSSGTVITASF